MAEQRTLDDLDPPAWGEPSYDSHLAQRAHELRRKPLADFTVEDLRLMIGQNVSLDHLVPRAIAIVEENPVAAGDYDDGDLLLAILGVGRDYWAAHPDEWWRVKTVADELARTLEEVRSAADSFEQASPFK